LLAALALAPAAQAGCSVPCGYIYPRLLMALGERGTTYELTDASPLHLEGNLTFTWDITAEGMAVQNPTSPILVTFSFPRKPDWLNVTMEPAQLEIPITPQYMVPSTDGTTVQVVYRYTAPLALTAKLTAQPIVDPELPPSLLILAQSSESGLYKPGFGVRDLPLDLPGAIVQTAQRDPAAELRVGDAVPLELPALEVPFEGATISLRAASPIELWKPVALEARVGGAAGPLSGMDMAASVVDERSEVLYTTGLRHREDGALPFAYTFPGPGHFRVLVAARPLAVTDAPFEPVVAEFDVLLPGTEYDALRYPDTYRAQYAEPTSELHANTADLPRQYEKLLRFPVIAGADSASVQVQLGSTAGAAVGAGSMYVEVLGPSDDQLSYGKLDAITPSMDARLRGPLPPGEYKVRLYGTGANPLGLAGTELQVALGVFYPEPPVGRVETRGSPRPMLGGPIALGTGGMELDLVLEQDPALWTPFHATLVAKNADGATALHPDFILTARGPDGAILHTTGHRHPHDGVLEWGFAFPSPGLYTISAYAGPTPEASGAFWQPAIASWPILLPVPADGVVHYPATYEAVYHDSTSSVRAVGGTYQYAFDKSYPVPIKAGATRFSAELALATMAVVQHVDGAAPAALTLHLMDPAGKALAEGMANAVGSAAVEAQGPFEPGMYTVHVTGLGYAPLDYSGAMYELHVLAEYPEGPVENLGSASAPAPAPEPARTPGFEPLLAAAAVGAALLAARRRR
jgi:hypothetical protein